MHPSSSYKAFYGQVLASKAGFNFILKWLFKHVSSNQKYYLFFFLVSIFHEEQQKYAYKEQFP